MTKMYAAVGVKANLDTLIAGLQEIRHAVGSVRVEELKVENRSDLDEYVLSFNFEPDVPREERGDVVPALSPSFLSAIERECDEYRTGIEAAIAACQEALA